MNLEVIIRVGITRFGRSIKIFYFSRLKEVVETRLLARSHEDIWNWDIGVHKAQVEVAIMDFDVICRIVEQMDEKLMLSIAGTNFRNLPFQFQGVRPAIVRLGHILNPVVLQGFQPDPT